MRKRLHQILCAGLILLGLDVAANAQTAEPAFETVKIVRQVNFHATNWVSSYGKNSASFRVEINLIRQPDGTLSGPGVYEFRWQHDYTKTRPVLVWDGRTEFVTNGAQRGNTISVTAPRTHTVTVRNDWGAGGIKTTVEPFDVYNRWNEFNVTLSNFKFSSKDRQEFVVGGNPIVADVATEITATPAPSLRVAVAAKQPIIPGHLRYFNELTLTLSGPMANPKGANVLVKLEAGDSGRLSEDQGWSTGTPTLRLAAVRPGETRTFFYAWGAAPPVNVHRATVTATVEGTEAQGSASFDVGVDFEVVSVERMMKRPPEIGRPEPLRIKVRDALHPGKSAEELAGALGLKPELSLKQTGYQPGTTLSDFITGFSINSSAIAEILAGAMTGKGEAFVMGNMLSWTVGSENVLSGAGGDLGYPYAKFQQRGLFFFEVDISGLAYTPYGGGVIRDVRSTPKPVTIAVTELDPETEFLVNVLVPCIQGLMSATTGEPVEGWKAVWQCLDNALASQLAQQALADHVLINTMAIWIAEMIDGGIEVAEAAGQVLKPQTAEEVQEQVIEQFQEVAGQMNDTVVAAVSKNGLTTHEVASARDGRLARGAERLDLEGLTAASAPERRRAAEAYAPHKRIQEGKRFLAVPTSRGDALTLDLAGDGAPGELIVVSKTSSTRAKYPASPWRSKLEIGSDGTLRVVSGSSIEVHSTPARRIRDSQDAAGPAAADTPTADKATSDELWQKLKSEQAEPPHVRVGGPCEYLEIRGRAKIGSIEKTKASKQQARTSGGPGHEGLEVRYTFVPDGPISHDGAKGWASRSHVLQLKNSWYPGPRFVAKYGLKEGRDVSAILKAVTKGSCTPYVLELKDVDLADYFESGR